MDEEKRTRIDLLRDRLSVQLDETDENSYETSEELAVLLPPISDDQFQAAFSDLSLAIDTEWLLHAWTMTNQGLRDFTECDRLDAMYIKLTIHWIDDFQSTYGKENRYALRQIEDLLDLLEIQAERRLEIGDVEAASESVSQMQSLAERYDIQLDDGQCQLVEDLFHPGRD